MSGDFETLAIPIYIHGVGSMGRKANAQARRSVPIVQRHLKKLLKSPAPLGQPEYLAEADAAQRRPGDDRAGYVGLLRNVADARDAKTKTLLDPIAGRTIGRALLS